MVRFLRDTSRNVVNLENVYIIGIPEKPLFIFISTHTFNISFLHQIKKLLFHSMQINLILILFLKTSIFKKCRVIN